MSGKGRTERPLLNIRWSVRLETERVQGGGAPLLEHCLLCVHETLALPCPLKVSRHAVFSF